MTNLERNYRSLREDEIRQLKAQGCTCADWSVVTVAEPFAAERVSNVDFAGKVSLGSLVGDVAREGTLAKPCGIHNARLQDCVIGNNVRIANVGSHVANYHIGDRVLIENIGVM